MYKTVQISKQNVAVTESASQVDMQSVCIICTAIDRISTNMERRRMGLSVVAEPLSCAILFITLASVLYYNVCSNLKKLSQNYF